VPFFKGGAKIVLFWYFANSL